MPTKQKNKWLAGSAVRSAHWMRACMLARWVLLVVMPQALAEHLLTRIQEVPLLTVYFRRTKYNYCLKTDVRK